MGDAVGFPILRTAGRLEDLKARGANVVPSGPAALARAVETGHAAEDYASMDEVIDPVA